MIGRCRRRRPPRRPCRPTRWRRRRPRRLDARAADDVLGTGAVDDAVNAPTGDRPADPDGARAASAGLIHRCRRRRNRRPATHAAHTGRGASRRLPLPEPSEPGRARPRRRAGRTGRLDGGRARSPAHGVASRPARRLTPQALARPNIWRYLSQLPFGGSSGFRDGSRPDRREEQYAEPSRGHFRAKPYCLLPSV